MEQIGGGTGTVRISDVQGNVYATFTSTGAAAWATAQTANLPADLRTYVIEMKTSGVGTVALYALSCFCYET
jgi:hypothetical protein